VPLPANVTTISVHGEIVSPNGGSPASGRVHFRIPYPLRATTDNALIGPQTLTAELDAAGEFTISLIATDDPDISPSDWVYDVRVETDVWRDRFNIEVPFDGGSLEFADITPAVTPPAVVTYALASALTAHEADTTNVHNIPDTAALVTTARQVIAGTGLTGGGTLAADRTLTVSYGSSAGTAAQGNDARLSDARTPTVHASTHAAAGADPVTLTQAQITGLVAALAEKAALAGATFTGVVTVDDANFIVLGTDKGYRFRPLGSRLDCEATGSDWQFSVFSGTAFDGTQRNYLRLESGVQLAHAIGPWVWAETPDDTAVHSIDGTGAGAVGFFGAAAVGQRSITGATAQDQIDSIVAALAAFGLATDDR
jgi:hypothetical protein